MISHDSSSEPSTPEQGGRVVSFRRRATGPNKAAAPPPVEDLDKFVRDDTPDDYRQRMIINVVAFTFVAVLVIGGFWLADTMANMRKNQDCVLSGRRNCASVNIPSGERF